MISPHDPNDLCALCDHEHETICDECGRLVCYGCSTTNFSGGNMCSECAMEIDDDV